MGSNRLDNFDSALIGYAVGIVALTYAVVILTDAAHPVVLLFAVVLLTVQAFIINRAAGVPYPRWSPAA